MVMRQRCLVAVLQDDEPQSVTVL